MNEITPTTQTSAGTGGESLPAPAHGDAARKLTAEIEANSFVVNVPALSTDQLAKRIADGILDHHRYHERSWAKDYYIALAVACDPLLDAIRVAMHARGYDAWTEGFTDESGHRIVTNVCGWPIGERLPYGGNPEKATPCDRFRDEDEFNACGFCGWDSDAHPIEAPAADDLDALTRRVTTGDLAVAIARQLYVDRILPWQRWPALERAIEGGTATFLKASSLASVVTEACDAEPMAYGHGERRASIEVAAREKVVAILRRAVGE